MPTIPLLARVQTLPTAYDTNNVTNNTAKLLARVMACELLPENTPAIFIYDSAIVHSQHLALLGHTYTNRQRTRTVFPAISWILAQRLEAISPRLPLDHPTHYTQPTIHDDSTPTLMTTIMDQIHRLPPCGKTWMPHKNITPIHTSIYIKIKSHQLRSNGYPKYHARHQPYLALVHSNHWAYKPCELPHTATAQQSFPLCCNTTRILSPLYFHPMNMYYGLYPVDTDVSDFTAIAYQAEIIIRLATKPEMGWYARNMHELQKPNRTIGCMGPTRCLITHQATSWTQHLYKDKDSRLAAQRFHHPHPAKPLTKDAVTNTMKLCPFCSDTNDNPQMYMYGDSIHLHIHCTNAHLQQTRDVSNIDISQALKHLCALFPYTPYLRNSNCVPFETFLSSLLHQYDNNTRQDTTYDDPEHAQPYQHATMAPRPHRSITSLVTEWNRLRPLLTTDSADLLTYTLGLVSSLPPANYSRASMNMVDHLYIGILPRSLHTTSRQFFSFFVTQQQRAHERRFPRSRTTLHIMSVYWDHAKTHAKTTPELLDAMNCLRPAQDMKLYRIILKAWNKVSIALLQRACNVQTIVKALVRNHSHIRTRLKKRTRARYTIPEPSGLTLVQTLLPASLRSQSVDTPTSTHFYTNT